jgi:hypothetical protein
MAAEEGSFDTQRRAQEWVVVADYDNLDRIAVDEGRWGSPPLAEEYQQQYGELDVDWRIVDKPLEHNSFGAFAKAAGLIPVKIEVSVDALERHKKDMIYGVSRAEFDKGLGEIARV